jgi:hypothetical protein
VKDHKTGHTAEPRTVCQMPEDKTTDNQSGCLVLSHITLGAVRDRSNAAGCRVTQDSCRICPCPPPTLELLPVSNAAVPWVPGAGLLAGHAAGWIWLARSS